MAAVFKPLVLTWGKDDDGNPVEYTVTPTMSLLNRIEAQDISLSGIALRIGQGSPPFSHIATAIAIILNHAGASVKPDEVYEEITHMDESTLIQMVEAIMLAAFPWSGKAEAPATPRKKSSRTRKK